MQMHFEIVRVDAEVAASWLAKPWARQRSLSAQVTRKYARSMAAGRWEEPSLDPIGFTVDGLLANGQHRLSAVIEAGWSGDMLIAYDVPEENFLVHDTGRHRLAAQFVRLPHAKVIASMARLILWYDERHPASPRGGGTLFDNDEILAFVDDSANTDLLVECARDAENVKKNTGLPPSVHGAVLFIARRGGADADRVASWVDGLQSGAGLEVNDPRLALRNKLARQTTIRRDQVVMWYLVVRAFNAHMAGRTLGSLLGHTDGPIPVIKFTRYQRTAHPRGVRVVARSTDERPYIGASAL